MNLSYARTIPITELFYFKFDGTGPQIPNLAQAPPVGTDTDDLICSITLGGSLICNEALVGTGESSGADYVDTPWTPNLNGVSCTTSFWTFFIPLSSTLFDIKGDVNSSGFRCFTKGLCGANNSIFSGP
jgi:hypothetical protein